MAFVTTRARFKGRSGAWVLLALGLVEGFAACSCSDDESNQGTVPVAGRGGQDASAGTGGRGGASGASGAGAGGTAGALGMAGTAGASASGGSAGSGGTGGDAGVIDAGDAADVSTGGTAGGHADGGGDADAEGGLGQDAGPNCGPEGALRGCPLPQVLATTTKPWGLALDDGYVYWTTREINGRLMRAPAGGGGAETIVSGEVFPHDLAVRAGNAYFCSADSAAGHLIKVTIGGATRRVLLAGDALGTSRVNTDGNFVYYVTNWNVVKRVPVAGGTSEQLAGGPFNSIIVDMVLSGDHLYFANNGRYKTDFSAREPGTAGISKVGVADPNSRSELVTRLDYPQFEIAADQNNVFWSDEQFIYRTSVDGGTFSQAVPLAAAPPDESPVADMISDGSFLYYADAHTLYRVAASGGSPQAMSGGWGNIGRLAIDAGSVYFTDNAGGAVVKVAKTTRATAQSDAGTGGTGGSGGSGGSAGTGGAAGATDAGIDAACGSEAGVHGCPEPSILASVSRPWGIAYDDAYVYFTTREASGAVMRTPIAGGAPEPIVTGEAFPNDLAVKNGSAFWCAADSQAGHVFRAPVAGGAKQQLAAGIAAGVVAVSSDGLFVYYATGYNAVMKVAAGGGTATLITSWPYTSNIMDMVLFDDELFWTNNGSWDATFTAKLPKTATINKAHVSATSTRHAFVTGLDFPQFEIAVDRSNVFYSDEEFIYRTDKSGRNPIPFVPLAPAAAGQSPIADMVSDGSYLYFADAQTVYKVPVSGGAPRAISWGWQGIRHLAFDDSNLYFTDNVGGSVVKMAK